MKCKFDWIEIQKYYDEGHTWREISKEFGVTQSALLKAKKRGEFNTTTRSEAMKLASAKNPRTHTEETKQKLSQIRKQYLKDNPDKVPYLLNHYSKGESYPEKYFSECFQGTNIVKNIVY